jgi:type IV secretion system protein VirB8
VRRNSLRATEDQTGTQSLLFLNGAQAISIVALACAVYVLSDLHWSFPW